MVIVQIGTNMGSWEVYKDGNAGPVINENGEIHFDSCLKFVKENSNLVDFLHLIEPIAECNPHINKSYDFFISKKIYNVAITNDSSQSKLLIYRPTNSKTNGHSSYDRNHLVVNKHKDIESIEVVSFTLNDFFELNKIIKCDRLYVDAEGLDCLILLEYDHNRYGTNYIEFEIVHSDGPYNSSVNANRYLSKLISDGFTINKSDDNLNLIATR